MNMIKKIIFSLVLVLAMGTLTACKDEIPDLSEEEMQMVEEYAAELLLKYDKNYSTSVLSEEDIEAKKAELEAKAELQMKVQAQKEAEQKEKEEAKQNDNTNENAGEGDAIVEAPVYADIAEFLGFENVSVDFKNYIVADSYPTNTESNDWQGIATAGNGNKLVAFEFEVTNNNASDYTVDFLSKNIKASVKVNSRHTKAPLTTLLSNDMLYYRDSIPSGETRTLVILIELSDADAADISSAVLTLKSNGDKMETKLL